MNTPKKLWTLFSRIVCLFPGPYWFAAHNYTTCWDGSKDAVGLAKDSENRKKHAWQKGFPDRRPSACPPKIHTAQGWSSFPVQDVRTTHESRGPFLSLGRTRVLLTNMFGTR